ncbi:hypothetical protein SK128_026073, partial [Halocaridina rubra]
PGESGKTTIIKQMKILHIDGFSPEEKKERGEDIRNNILDSMTTLIVNMERLNIKVGLPENQESIEYIKTVNREGFTFPEEFYTHVEKLWRDRGIQQTYTRQNEFQLIDCAKYFLDQLDVVKQPEYEPSVQDILHSRRRTTDIQKIEFTVNDKKTYGGGPVTFWMFDVGGQRGERKKWIQVFDGINAVLFLVSSSCFDLVIEEDQETNRLQEAITIFKSVWASRFLKDSGFIIFLNKQDILKDKIVNQGKSIGDYFPEYSNYKLAKKDMESNEDEEYLRTRSFIRDKFMSIASKQVIREGKKVTPGLPALPDDKNKGACFPHFITATDTDKVKLVFDDVQCMIILWNLQTMGAAY